MTARSAIVARRLCVRHLRILLLNLLLLRGRVLGDIGEHQAALSRLKVFGAGLLEERLRLGPIAHISALL